ncbi:MAG TPA: hypothetical protein VEL07_04745 [Planctomycetota bacterium]|nr:hypothetical protein [Planctomycetota bacterium]
MHPPAAVTRTAMTLFEVAISLALLALCVTSIALIFPAGLRAQQMARFGVYAAIKAEEMVEAFASTHNSNPVVDVESPTAWDVPSSYRAFTHDLEARLASPRYGIMPLPLAIARRLDSDDDQIQRILDQGGHLYYSQAAAAEQLQEEFARTLGDAPPNELQKLIFAVDGFAQQNAMHETPWKAWPYYVAYPSPPMHTLFRPGQYAPPSAQVFDYPTASYPSLVHEGVVPTFGVAAGVDPDMAVVFDATDGAKRYGFKPYAYDIGPHGDPTEAAAIAYVQAALWYCTKKGLPREWYDPPGASPAPLDAFSGATPAHVQVNAMRFLAHATSCMTRWRTLADLGGQPSAAGSGVDIPAATIAGLATEAIKLSHDEIVYHHESCLRLGMRFAAAYPYDWGAPRPQQRAIMMDYPLVQYDLFQPPLAGTIFDGDFAAGSVPAAQWRPLPARPIANSGVAATFPDRAVGLADAAYPGSGQIWSTATERFTLTASFEPEERCRELLFWAVDWQSYEDCELSPSAPVDASKYAIAGPLRGASFLDRMEWNDWADHHLYDSRNPEKNLAFTRAVADRATGASITDALMANEGGEDKGRGMGARQVFSGLHGADRDFDGTLDRGPLPVSIRLRATRVARFNFYDPRVAAIIR